MTAFLLAAAIQEWTGFRGPNGTGISPAKDLPVTWTEKDFRWRAKLPGTGHAQPVLWGDRIFVVSAKEDGRQRVFSCLSAADGKELWSKTYTYDTHGKHKLNSFASSTPTVDKDRLYAIMASPTEYVVKAWDHAGKELWSVNLGVFEGKHAHAASPFLAGGKLIVPNDQSGTSFIAALDPATGKTLWKSDRRPADNNESYATPCLLQREGKPAELLYNSFAHGICSLNPETGALNWEARVFDKRAVSSPVVAGDLVLGTCGSGGGGMYLSAVKLGGKGDVTETHVAYTIKKEMPYVPTPLVVGPRIFLISDAGFANCVEAATGKVLWSERLGGQFYASPILADGRIYINSKEGETVVLEAGDAFKVLARNPLGEGSHTTAAVSGGRLYLKSFTHLACVGGK